MEKLTKLRVVEALQDDAYKGIARIDPDLMRKLKLVRGDIISIKGGRETFAIVDRAYPADMGERIIRIDGITRKNAKTGIGELVEINKPTIKEASKITIAPAQQGIVVQGDPEGLKQGLLGRAVSKGDIVVLGGAQRRKDLMSEEFGDFFGEIGDIFSQMGMGGFPGIAQLRFIIVSTSPNQPCVITENTQITLSPKAVEVSEDALPGITYEDIGGLKEEVKKVREMVELPLKHPEIFSRLGIEPPKGVLLYGPPGTGKTLLAKAVANEADAHFILLNGPEIMSKFYGESEKKIRDIFDDAEKNAPSIIFIDELDAIAPKREDVGGEVERRVVSQLLTMMDGLQSRGKVIVIGATNRPNALDPALRRPGRFDREVEISVPDKDGRLSILKIHTRNMPITPPVKKQYIESKIEKIKSTLEELSQTKAEKPENEESIKHNKEELEFLSKAMEDFSGDEKKDEKILKKFTQKEQDKLNSVFLECTMDELASKTHGFVGADISALTKEAAMSVLRRLLPEFKLEEGEEIKSEILEKLRVYKKDFDDALKTVRPSAMREVLVETPNTKWEDIGGIENVKRDLREAVEWPLKYPDSFERMGIRPPKGVLLYGPPGTGKTLLAKAVANESEANFIQVKGPSLLSMWVGKSLPYNEEMLVKENNIIKKMKIGEIVEKKAEVEVLAFDKDKKISFAKINDYIKHKLNDSLIEITTRTGRKIKVTKYHSLFSFMNGRFGEVASSHLIENESYIAIPKNLNLPKENIKTLNLYESFKDDKEVFISNSKDYLIRAKKILGLDKAAKILDVSKKYYADISGKNLPVSLPNFNELIIQSKLALDLNELKIKLKSSTNEYPCIFNINKDFWRLVGLWIAEGDFNDGVRIHNQNQEIREDIGKICEKYGFKICETKTSIIVSSIFLRKIFEKVLGLKNGSASKNLPIMSFMLDKESKANLLKGYFSGDGSIYSAERGKFKIEAGTISIELANDLMYLLLDFGIVSTCYQTKLRTGSTNYRLSILGVKNFEKFSDMGFIEKIKNNRIKEYINSRKWQRSDLIPLSGELYDLVAQSNKVYSSNQCIGKECLKSMLVYADKDKTKYKEYWDLVEGDIYFDLVKEIKEVKEEEYVYDVGIAEKHNFVAGFGGIIAHNSEEGVRKIFERARQVSPCIIFFDEIDSLASRRGGEATGGAKVTEQVLNQMLAEMDGLEELHNVIVIGATNRPDILDPALMRPGRFDRIVFVSVPDKDGRLSILKIHTKNMPLAKDINLNEIAERTDGYTGADLESLAREAAMIALREDIDTNIVSKSNFEKAMEKVSPSVSRSDQEKYKQVEQKYLRSAKSALPLVSYTG